jgi:predicted nuclease with TOPRIM domain
MDHLKKELEVKTNKLKIITDELKQIKEDNINMQNYIDSIMNLLKKSHYDLDTEIERNNNLKNIITKLEHKIIELNGISICSCFLSNVGDEFVIL